MYIQRQAVKPSRPVCNILLIRHSRVGRESNNNTMKRVFTLILSAVICLSVSAQMSEAQKAAADAARLITSAPEVAPKVEKPKYWATSLKTQINVGQTQLTNWAAGGDNTVSLAAFIDGNANWKKGDMFWNNRLQLDYGFLYASSKPLLQKSTDRIYLESKWGYKTESMKNFYFSANYDFKSQFSSGYDYKTPAKLTDENDNDLVGADLRQAWRDARVLKSGFLAPAYTNIALGLDYVPAKWLSINFAPLTGGFVIVKDAALRKSYSMKEKKSTTAEMITSAEAALTAATTAEEKEAATIALGNLYRSANFEFGAQLKADAKVNINDNFSYSTQVVLFVNYLDIKHCPRINWDNRIDWKLAKYFSLTLTTNLIYDDQILIKNDRYPDGKKGLVQFKESVAFGFTYTIANKK